MWYVYAISIKLLRLLHVSYPILLYQFHIKKSIQHLARHLQTLN